MICERRGAARMQIGNERENTMSGLKGAARAALCAGILVAGAGSAEALELKDLNIRFQAVQDMQGEKITDWLGFSAIAGNIVWLVSTRNCPRGQSMIYKPGTFTGTDECPATRNGTASMWTELGGTARFDTKMTVSGNNVTLAGRLTSQGTRSSMYCGTFSKKEQKEVYTQTLRIRIVGMTCQVLQYESSKTVTTRYLEGGDGTPETSVITYRAAPGTKCVVSRRSEQPVAPPPELRSVVSRC
jgi:hypothetical protein